MAEWTVEHINRRDKQITDLTKEIEQLRHDYAELADRSVAAAKNAVVPYQAEIERLRGLLREMLDGYCADNLTQQDVEQRVREALGEKA